METFMTTAVARRTWLPFRLSVFPARDGAVGERPMQRVLVAINRLARTEDGQDLLEYGMIVVLIALAAVVAVTSVGSTINAVLWQVIASSNF